MLYNPILAVKVVTVTMCHTLPIAFTSTELGRVLITTSPPSYKEWIQGWTSQPLEAADKLRVPAEASKIISPFIVDNWRVMLAKYPNKSLVDFFISGIQEGFRIGFTPCNIRIKSAKRNLNCAVEHPDVVESCLAEEVELGCISGPFPVLQYPRLVSAGLGSSPKTTNPIGGN